MAKNAFVLPAVVVLLLFGIGTAYALTLNGAIAADEEPWAGEEAIAETIFLTVDEYRFTYSADLTQITDVEVDIANEDVAQHDAIVNCALYDIAPPGNTVTQGGSTIPTVVATATTVTFTVNLAAPIDITDANVIRIIIDDLGT